MPPQPEIQSAGSADRPWVEKIETLVRQAEAIADPGARRVTIELLQAVMDFHRAAIDRAMEIVAESADGDRVIAQLADEDLTSSLLLVHDLHPDDTGTRLARAVAKLEPMFRSLGARLRLSGIAGGVVYLDFDSSRSWPGAQTRASIEKVVFQAAPEIETVIVEGLKEELPAGFVPLSELLAASHS